MTNSELRKLSDRSKLTNDQVLSLLDQLDAAKDKLTKNLSTLQAHEECFRIAVESLELVAAPKRSDGTYNRCRESCEVLATEALTKILETMGTVGTGKEGEEGGK